MPSVLSESLPLNRALPYGTILLYNLLFFLSPLPSSPFLSTFYDSSLANTALFLSYRTIFCLTRVAGKNSISGVGVKVSLPVHGLVDDVIHPPETGPNIPHTAGAGKGVDGSDPNPSTSTPISISPVQSSEGVFLHYSSPCSTHDVPTARTITLSPTQRVTGVGIRCSTVIEGMSITIGDTHTGRDSNTGHFSGNSDVKDDERVKGEGGVENKGNKCEVSHNERESVLLLQSRPIRCLIIF